jgi:SAM-dependent methyltransferase
MACPLCLCECPPPYAAAHGRDYFRCPRCDLVFMDPVQRPDADAERAHYATHRNDAGDPRYRRFLDRLAAPLAQRLAPGASGLDYGCGPGPTLSLMLEEKGFRMRVHDPFFAPDPAALAATYDFITATEVVEHFFEPRQEFGLLDRLLRPGGWLGVMTEIMHEDRDLAAWRYARDPTHVSFYAPATLRWIAGQYGWHMEAPHPNVVLFRKG